jgi:hypothetical protein
MKNKITLIQGLSLMDKINEFEGDIFESFFEGDGSGKVKFIVQDKFYTILKGGYYGSQRN